MLLRKKISSVSQAIRQICHKKEDLAKKPLNDASDGIEIMVANSKELREKSYALMYEIYLEKEYIKENSTKMHFTEHDLLLETIVLLAIKDNEVVGTISIVPDNAYGLPAEKSFSDELHDFKRNNKICEISALGIKKDLRFSETILIKLINISVIIALGVLKRSHYMIVVNPRHVAFYTKKMLFEKIGDEKEFEKVSGAPAVLLSTSLKELEEEILKLELSSKSKFLKKFVSVKDGGEIIRKLQKELNLSSTN